MIDLHSRCAGKGVACKGSMGPCRVAMQPPRASLAKLFHVSFPQHVGTQKGSGKVEMANRGSAGPLPLQRGRHKVASLQSGLSTPTSFLTDLVPFGWIWPS